MERSTSHAASRPLATLTLARPSQGPAQPAFMFPPRRNFIRRPRGSPADPDRSLPQHPPPPLSATTRVPDRPRGLARVRPPCPSAAIGCSTAPDGLPMVFASHRQQMQVPLPSAIPDSPRPLSALATHRALPPSLLRPLPPYITPWSPGRPAPRHPPRPLPLRRRPMDRNLSSIHFFFQVSPVRAEDAHRIGDADQPSMMLCSILSLTGLATYLSPAAPCRALCVSVCPTAVGSGPSPAHTGAQTTSPRSTR